MNRRLVVSAGAAVFVAACAGPVEVPRRTDEPVVCPSSVEDATAMTFPDDTFVGAGYVIRFVPSPDEAFRGYDLNITRTFTGRPFMDVRFLRIHDEIPGLSQGEPVLVVARRTENPRVFTPDACAPLIRVSADNVEP
ncbi:MAG TPA: hypothetical protein VFN76_03525 [Candidatus Limnocylindria bacterium]|nr:hypothetical protein [Candidatus Limnocylindria bacterium]